MTMLKSLPVAVVCILSAASAKEECAAVVSKIPGVKNDECYRLCEAEDDTAFEESCLPAQTCFDNWIFGYSPLERNGLAGRFLRNVKSAETCQHRCQKAGDCVRFSYDPSTELCVLKSMEAASNALALAFDAPISGALPPTTDRRWRYCNLVMQNKCLKTELGIDCLQCGEEKRCVWKDELYVSGPAYCGVEEPTPCKVQLAALIEGEDDTAEDAVLDWSVPPAEGATSFDFQNMASPGTGANPGIPNSGIPNKLPAIEDCGGSPCAGAGMGMIGGYPMAMMVPALMPVMLPSFGCDNSACGCGGGDGEGISPCMKKFIDDKYPDVDWPAADPFKLCGEKFVFEVLFLQDVSYSFTNDMPQIQRQIPELMSILQDKFPGSRFGLASFSDKPIKPFGYERSLDHCYQLRASLTEDQTAVSSALDKLFITSGNDWRESQMEALLHGALSPRVGFSYESEDAQGRKILRVIVTSTDAGFHLAGDGHAKAGLKPCSGDAYLQCKTEDYPALIQVEDAIIERGIIPMFLTTDDVFPIYEALLVKFSKRGIFGVVGEIADDSSNLVASVLDGIDTICQKEQA